MLNFCTNSFEINSVMLERLRWNNTKDSHLIIVHTMRFN